MVKPSILIVGHEGQVAFELQRTLACLGKSRPGTNTQPRWTCPTGVDPGDGQKSQATLIVNAAAYAVDKAEQEPELAHRINAEAAGMLAERPGHRRRTDPYSTDYVFPGDAPSLSEDAPVGPLGVYGQTNWPVRKRRQSGVQHLILRTAWVYGGRGQNFY